MLLLRQRHILIQEIQDERYELLFGDGIFGKKLENGAVITVQYVVTGGIEGNGSHQYFHTQVVYKTHWEILLFQQLFQLSQPSLLPQMAVI